MNAAGQDRLLAGRYRLTSVIGRGGMGTVWHARDELLDRDVAVKEIVWPSHFSDAEREDARLSAVTEARIAARLSHPNVVGIYDIITEDGRPWIVMQLVPYPSLRDILVKDGPLSPGHAAQVGLGILAALSAAHAKGIMHRDVKPANVLVGPDRQVVLTDFGIARAGDSPVTTVTTKVVGSPPYISPERARGEQAGTPGDMWGLGATLYAAVEGHPPFDRDDPIATLTAVVDADPAPAAHAGPLEPVISGLLHKDPAARLEAAETSRLLTNVVLAGIPAARAESEAERVPVPLGPLLLAEPESLPGHTVILPAQGVPPEPALPAQRGKKERGKKKQRDGKQPANQPDEKQGDEPKRDKPKPDGPQLDRPQRRPHASVAVAVFVAVLGIGAASASGILLARGTLGNGTSAAGLHHPGAPAPGTSRPGSASQPPRSSQSSPPPSPSSGGTGTSGSSTGGNSTGGNGASQNGSVPAGFYRFTNSTGFSLGVPRGWGISHVGHYVYVTDPANPAVYLLIDQSDQPKSDPLADWEQQQSAREGTYPAYHLIRLEDVTYPQAEKSADWEFTYVRGGVPVHVLNRNVLANAHHAYALYWTTPQSDWAADYRYFQEFAATFRPAAG